MIYKKEDNYIELIKILDFLTNQKGLSDKDIALSIGKYPQYLYSIKKKTKTSNPIK